MRLPLIALAVILGPPALVAWSLCSAAADGEGHCLRCGGDLIAEDYQQLRRIIDEDRELCDDCADELLPDINAMEPVT